MKPENAYVVRLSMDENPAHAIVLGPCVSDA
jgi:hypothetical protein